MRAGTGSRGDLRTLVQSTTTYAVLMRLEDAQLGYNYAIRVRGQNITWRVVLDGWAGEETLATNTIVAGDPQTVRVPGLPTVLAGTQLRLEAKLATAGDPVDVLAEASWLLVDPARGPS